MADLTSQQKATLKAFILADPTLSQFPPGSDGAYAIAAIINLPASPDFIVWKTDVSVDDIMRNGMNWTRVDNLSVGKARIWDWMTRLGTLNASKVNIRSGIDATWTGTAADDAVRAMVYTHCKRKASVIEKILATGVGSDASPATMEWEGTISYQAVDEARTS